MGKIVRDKIPEIIKANGKRAKIERVSGELLVRGLEEKLREEVEEFFSEHDLDKSVEELADIYEVLVALARENGYDLESFMLLVTQKRLDRGGFEEGFYWSGNEDCD